MATDNENISTKKALSIGEFRDMIIDYVFSHKILVFLVFPTILSPLYLWFVTAMNGQPPKEVSVFIGVLLVPHIFLWITLLTFGFTGNHPASGNQGCMMFVLLIVYVPLFLIAYLIYRIAFSITKIVRTKIHNHKENVGAVSLEKSVERLNELLKSGLISKSDYDEQLSRLISKTGVSQ